MKNLSKILLLLALSLLTAASFAAGTKASKTLLVYETVGQPPAYTTSFKVYTSSLGYSSASGLSFNLAAAQEQGSSASTIAQIPEIPALDSSGNSLTQSVLLANANNTQTGLPYYVGPLASQMVSNMSSAGAASAIFNFQQQVMVQGNTQPMYLTWQVIVDVNGRPRYGDVKLIPTVPNFVYADYTSLAVAATLPASFASLQNGIGGTIVWYQVAAPQIVTQSTQQASQTTQLQQITAAQTINATLLVNGVTVGAYDAPVANPTATTYPAGCTVEPNTGLVGCDPDYGLKCLINHQSDPYTAASPNPANPNDIGCPAAPINGYTDFISMENANGASGGYVDYVRSLTPVYATSTDSSGNTVQTAVVTVSVDTRTWTGQNGYTNCNYGNYVPVFNPSVPYISENGESPPLSDNAFYASCINGGGEGAQTYCTLDETGSYVAQPGTGAPYNYYGLYECQDTSGNAHYFMSDGSVSSSFVYSGGSAGPYPIIVNGGALTTYNIASPFSYVEVDNTTGAPVSSQTYTVMHPSLTALDTSTTVGYITYTISPVNISSTNGGSSSGNSPTTYNNTGRIGYQVQSVVDRYYVTPDGNFSPIGEVTNSIIAPTQSYNKTVTLPSGSNAASYSYIIIDPFNTTQTYDYRNDTVNYLPASQYIYVAPIVTN